MQIGLREGRLRGLERKSLRILQARESAGPGNVVMVEINSEHVTELVTFLRSIGIRAETVAEDVAKRAKAYVDSNAAVGRHLADQLLLPMALSGGGSFAATEISRHAETNVEVIAKFLSARFEIE